MTKKFALALLCLCLLTVPSAPVHAESSPWSVTIQPIFAFSGDNLTIKIVGVPNSYVFYHFSNASGVEFFDGSAFTNVNGTANSAYELPYDLPTGDYSVHLIYKGAEVANATVSVVMEEIVYLQHRLEEVAAVNARLREMFAALHERQMKNEATFNQVRDLYYIQIFVLFMVGAVIVRVLGPYIRWRISNSDGKNQGTKVLRFFNRMNPEGDMGAYVDGVEEARETSLAERNASVVPKRYLLTVKEGNPLALVNEVEEMPLDGPVRLVPLKDGVVISKETISTLVEDSSTPVEKPSTSVEESSKPIADYPLPIPSTTAQLVAHKPIRVVMSLEDEAALRLKAVLEREEKKAAEVAEQAMPFVPGEFICKEPGCKFRTLKPRKASTHKAKHTREKNREKRGMQTPLKKKVVE